MPSKRPSWKWESRTHDKEIKREVENAKECGIRKEKQWSIENLNCIMIRDSKRWEVSI